jgi:rod shape-determining protein MreC
MIKKNEWVSYIRLQAVNDSLMNENALLRNKMGIPTQPNPLKDSTYTKIKEEDSVRQTTYFTHVPAKVLNNSIDKRSNYLTLDVGTANGIKKGMAVVSAKGIVGKISHVSKKFSVAISILSEKMTVSATTPDGSTGPISWDGKDPELLTLKGIPQSVKVKPLDTIFTSGYSIFPEKIMIGRAVKVLNGTSYLVWLSTNFRKLHYVYVIKDETIIERTIFEQAAEDSIINNLE